MPITTSTDLIEAAHEAAGNWKRFPCFVWNRSYDLPDADQWAMIYTHNRDSGLLDQSNASVIVKALESFTDGGDPNVVFESHNHWAIGHVDGLSIRVYRDAEITEAFRVYHELALRLDDYPILSDTDYSERELEATLENIPIAAGTLKHEFKLPEDWVAEVYDWLSSNRSQSIENVSDQGGWPDDDDFEAAFEALGYGRIE